MKKESKKKDQIKNLGKDKQVEKLEIQLKKALSDYQNLKRDMDKRLDFEEMMIRKSVMRSLIELADDIDLAIDNVGVKNDWKTGVSNILNKFYVVLKDLGGRIMEVKKGDEFDSDRHEAIGVVNEGKNGRIVKVVQNGYTLNEIVVRPARVIVCKSDKKSK